MKTDALLSYLLEGLDLPALEGRLAASPISPKELKVYEASPNDWFLVDETGTSWAVIYDPALAALLAHAPEDLAILLDNIRSIQKELERERALDEFLSCNAPSGLSESFDIPISERDVPDLAESPTAPDGSLAVGVRFTGKQAPGEVREILAIFSDSQRVQYRVIKGIRASSVRTCSIPWFLKWAGEIIG